MKKILLLIILLSCRCVNGQINLVFRCDDYRMIDDPLQEKIIDVFVKHNMPLCFCVIPADTCGKELCTISDTNLARWIFLKDRGLLDIGLHGFTHKINNLKYLPASELGGLTYEQQLSLFQKGKGMLEAHLGKITYFVPPRNLTNRFTISALENSGFDILSANGTWRDNYQRHRQLKLYPCTTEDFADFTDFYYSKRYRKQQIGTIILLFHPYTFDGKYTLDQLDTLLADLRSNPDFSVCTFETLKERSIPDYDGGLCNKYQSLMRLLFRDQLFYLNRPPAILLHLLFYLIYAFIGLVITLPIRRKVKGWRWGVLMLIYMFCIGISLFLLPVSFKVSLYITIVIGAVLDILFIQLDKKLCKRDIASDQIKHTL